MKLGILGDIHGNIEALKTAYNSLIELGVDKIYHLGDLGGYAPFVNEVVDFLIEHQIEGVQGNYDENVAYNSEHCGCKYEDSLQAEMAHLSFQWTKKNVTEKTRDFMKNLPFRINFQIEGKRVSIFHATPIKNNLYWYEDRHDKFFILMAQKAGADIMIYGHTHIPYFKKIGGKYFINAGSVGKPKDGDPRTCVCFVEIKEEEVSTQFIRKEYDIKRVIDAIIDRGLPYYFAEKLIIGK